MPWVSERDLAVQADVRLFCLPHAGSGTAGFHRWKRLLPKSIAVCPVMLPGREMRLAEPAMTRVEEIVAALHHAMKPWLDKPFAIFGHSMGAVLAYEWERQIERDGLCAQCVFVSGRDAPQAAASHQDLHALPDEALIRALAARWGGTPDVLLSDDEMREVFLPILRADLAMLASYNGAIDGRLMARLRCFAGERDPSVSVAGLEAWRDVVGSEFAVQRFAGDHFYHFGEGQVELLKAIADAL